MNVAPSIMQSIVEAVLSRDVTVQQVTLAYIDDVYINKSVAPAERVRQHFSQFGLESKKPEQFGDGARVPGLEVRGQHGTLWWKLGSVIPDIPEVVTCRVIFSLCGKLIGHLPVCGWLQAATGVIKRRANAVT